MQAWFPLRKIPWCQLLTTRWYQARASRPQLSVKLHQACSVHVPGVQISRYHHPARPKIPATPSHHQPNITLQGCQILLPNGTSHLRESKRPSLPTFQETWPQSGDYFGTETSCCIFRSASSIPHLKTSASSHGQFPAIFLSEKHDQPMNRSSTGTWHWHESEPWAISGRLLPVPGNDFGWRNWRQVRTSGYTETPQATGRCDQSDVACTGCVLTRW